MALRKYEMYHCKVPTPVLAVDHDVRGSVGIAKVG